MKKSKFKVHIYQRLTPSGCKDIGISLRKIPFIYIKKFVKYEWYRVRTWLLLQKKSFLVEIGEFLQSCHIYAFGQLFEYGFCIMGVVGNLILSYSID